MSKTPKYRAEYKCQECGCNCDSCTDINSIHLHQEIEDLKHRLNEKEHQIVTMESQIMMHANQYPHGEMQALRESLYSWQDKYERLLESYRKLQKVNQGLEDKLLRIADKFENEKITLTQNVADLTGKLTTAETSIASLQQEAVQYKTDCNLAIRMLQCKPSQFVSQKLESFPSDVQERVQQYLNYRRPGRDSEANGLANGKTGGKLIRIPMPTFPPTAVVYSLNRSAGESQRSEEPPDSSTSYVSAAIVAKILEEREKERLNRGGKCGKESLDMSTQTGEQGEFFIQMDESPGRGNMFNGRTAVMTPTTAHQFQTRPMSSPTVMRMPKSTPNETIII